jgi:DNA-binding CsgD family transcriptional regulator
LNLTSDAAALVPTLLLVDDAQWLDRPTCEVLLFIARRIESDQVVLLAAIRDGFQSPLLEAGLVEVHLRALDDESAAELLESHAPDLPSGLRQQVLREAQGNPLALVELPLALSGSDAVEGMFPSPLRLTARLERAFTSRAEDLPVNTRALLLVAACDDGTEHAEVLRAATILLGYPIGIEDLEPAISKGLIELNGTELVFRHPLVRSAVYLSANMAERYAAHSALAGALVSEPDRRAWHRAAATIGQNEEVACELEAAASRAVEKGGAAVAVDALERAAGLGDSNHRARRLLRAAQLAFQIGRFDLVSRNLQSAENLELNRLERARLAWIRDSFSDGTPGDPQEVRALIDAADEARAAGDADLGLNLLMGAGIRCWWADTGEEAPGWVIEAISRAGAQADDPRRLATIALAQPIRHSAEVRQRIDQIARPEARVPTVAWLLGMASHAAGNYETSTTLLSNAATGLRADGRLALLAQVLVIDTWSMIHLGNWPVARALADEGERLARETNQPIWTTGALLGRALVAGVTGDDELATRLADECELEILPRRLTSMIGVLHLVRGLTALTAGRHAEAYEQLRLIRDPSAGFHRQERHALVYFTDAAVHVGQRKEAVALIDSLETLASQSEISSLKRALLYARPLVAEGDEAEALFEAALRADSSQWPFYRAHTQLAFGTWLRRQRRTIESRAPLIAALETFNALGAVPWGERARQELRASGEVRRRRAPVALDSLTPQELQIAEMASAGLSNREIGARLYLSHRTVGTHLYRVFPKLGVTSRAQLRGALGAVPA